MNYLYIVLNHRILTLIKAQNPSKQCIRHIDLRNILPSLSHMPTFQIILPIYGSLKLRTNKLLNIHFL